MLAAAEGADFLGVILAPGGKRTVTPEEASVMLRGLSPRRVGVFVDAAEEPILAAASTAGLVVLQLHGDETPELAARLRGRGLTVWKALRPRSGGELAALLPAWLGWVDAVLLDGWSASAAGGTGARFPWQEVAAALASASVDVPLVVAGGLDAGNVGEVVRLLHPFAVDVSSGVEAAPRRKDPESLARFIRAARAARALE